MSSREETPDHASLPQAQRIDRIQAGLLASGSSFRLHLPKRQNSGAQWYIETKLAGYSCGNSAGCSPASLLSTLSRRPGAWGTDRADLWRMQEEGPSPLTGEDMKTCKLAC
jgi:hypothetical protein